MVSLLTLGRKLNANPKSSNRWLNGANLHAATTLLIGRFPPVVNPTREVSSPDIRDGDALVGLDSRADRVVDVECIAECRASATMLGGAPSGFRTPDPLIKSQLLYQLS